MPGRLAALVVVPLLFLAGCAAPPAALESAGDALSGVAERVELVAPTFLPPVRAGLAGTAAEPNLALAPDGTLYITTPLWLWRSFDGGATWEDVGEPGCVVGTPVGPPPVCPPGFERKVPGIRGGGDGDLAVDATGRLHWAGLFGPDAAIPYQRSDDRGDTWTDPVDVADGSRVDREWIEARGERVFVTWRDFGRTNEDPSRLLFRSSADRGDSWGPITVLDERDHLQGPIALDPSSEAIYVPFFDDGVAVARSVDNGTTWTRFEVAGFERDEQLRFNNGAIFPVAAVDRAGNVYVVWSIDESSTPTGLKDLTLLRVFFAASTDGGLTWTEPARISPEDRVAVFPWIVAGEAGRVAVAWYENTRGLPSDSVPDQWNVVLVESADADADAPTFLGGDLNEAPFHVGRVCTQGGGCTAARDRTRLDFFELVVKPDGHPLAVWVSDSPNPRRVAIDVGGVASGTPLVDV